MLEEIIKQEKLEATDEDIDAQIREIAGRYWMPEDKVKEILSSGGRMEDVKYDALMRKAVELIFSNAQLNNLHINRAELAQQVTEAMQSADDQAAADNADAAAQAEAPAVEDQSKDGE